MTALADSVRLHVKRPGAASTARGMAQEIVAPMQDVPYGYCQCGCGEKTSLAPQTHRSKGWVKGEPLRFCLTHAQRSSATLYEIDPESGCWVWKRQRGRGGYGLISIRGSRVLAHRVVYERHHGQIPDGLELDHLCRNPSCVNPDHLEPVTHAENIRRGRPAKLTHAAAFQMRLCYATTSLSLREFGEMFGVSKSAAKSVIDGSTWA